MAPPVAHRPSATKGIISAVTAARAEIGIVQPLRARTTDSAPQASANRQST